MAIIIVEKRVPATAVISQLLSVFVTATSGEIHVSGTTQAGAFDYTARASSPLFNTQNTAVALSEALPMPFDSETFLVISVLNTGGAVANGRVEIAACPNPGAIVTVVDTAITALAPQQCWSMHIHVTH